MMMRASSWRTLSSILKSGVAQAGACSQRLEPIIDFSGFLGGDFALVDEIAAALGVLGRAHMGPDGRAAA